MKRIFASILILLVLLFSQAAGAEEQSSDYIKHLKKIGHTLEQFDIVRSVDEKYNESSLISRRDAFQMAYIVKNSKRALEYEPDDVEAVAELCEKRMQTYLQNFEFSDVEPGTYDYALVYSLAASGLILGKTDDSLEAYPSEAMTYEECVELLKASKPKADLDGTATYEEALTIIGRMVYIPDNWSTYYDELDAIVDMSAEHPYYSAAIKNGLINSEPGSPVVSEDMLNQPVPAYEFMHLLYRALYIPTVYVGCYGEHYEVRYIDNYIGTSDFGYDLEYDGTKIEN